MRSDNGLLVDVGQIGQVVENADVFAIGFGSFVMRLLVDTRSNDSEGPMVRMVEPLTSVEERLFWLGKERGSFGMPQAFTFFGWPHSIAFLEESGLWQRIRERVGAGQDEGVAQQCDQALEEMRALERAAIEAAIRGRGFVSLWPPEQRRHRRAA